jgi:lipopolysaccharide assembly LptE-like protein
MNEVLPLLRRASVAAIWIVLAGMASCGYHVGGKADLIPKNIQTIAIPPFQNLTTRYTLTDRIPQAIAREFISRTRFQVVSDPNYADAILSGAVTNVVTSPSIFDPVTGKATSVQVNVFLQIHLRERVSGKLLYSRQNFEARNNYEISVDPSKYLDESVAALDRLSRDVARAVVSGVMENF